MIRQVKFRHANKSWLALFESYYIDPAHGKGQPERTPENLRMTWSIRSMKRGVQDLCLSGHWSEARGVYSIDRMDGMAPPRLIEAAFRRENMAEQLPQVDRARCCPGIAVSRKGVVSGHLCAICQVVRAQNAKIIAGIAERRRRLFDSEVEAA